MPSTSPNDVTAYSDECGNVKDIISAGVDFESDHFDQEDSQFFVNVTERCAIYYSWSADYKPGESFRGGAPQRIRTESDYSALRAIDPTTGERRWEYRFAGPALGSGGGSGGAGTTGASTATRSP